MIEVPEGMRNPLILQLVEVVNRQEQEIEALKQRIALLESTTVKAQSPDSTEKKPTPPPTPLDKVDEKGPVTGEELVATIDSDFEDLIPQFLQNRVLDAKRMYQFMAKRDLKSLLLQGHNLKGVGDCYGFDGIVQIGQELEIAVQRQNLAKIDQLRKQLLRYVENVKISYINTKSSGE